MITSLIVLAVACTRSVDDPGAPVPTGLQGKWVLTDTQGPGTGPPGAWGVANPSGRWFRLDSTHITGGTVFPAATGYQLTDSVTIKVIDPSQAAGFALYTYQIDPDNRHLYFYLRPPNGGYCFEGCGTLKFERQ